MEDWLSIASSYEDRMNQNSSERIMIVGRDLPSSYMLQRFVRKSAHPVIATIHSDDVLALARCEKPLAIVLEVDTPENVGWNLLRSLKSNPETKQIPVMACSWQDESARGLAEGADGYLRMPFLYEEFGTALAALLTKEENGENH
jgi:CheY-like chemotaxis protein